MIRLIALALVFHILAACASSNRDDHHLTTTTAAGAIEGRPTLGMPVSIPGSQVCLIPFSIEERKGVFQDKDPYTRPAAYSMARTSYTPEWFPGASVRWHNAAFHDLTSGNDWPVLTERGVINRYQVYGSPPRENMPGVAHAVVFLAVLADTNKDGRLDDLDANVALIADGQGRNLTEVSPRDAQVWDVRYDHAHQVIYLEIVPDTNADGRFTSADAPSPLVVHLDPIAPAPLVTPQTRALLDQLMK